MGVNVTTNTQTNVNVTTNTQTNITKTTKNVCLGYLPRILGWVSQPGRMQLCKLSAHANPSGTSDDVNCLRMLPPVSASSPQSNRKRWPEASTLHFGTLQLIQSCALDDASDHANALSGIPQVSASANPPNPHHLPGDSTLDLLVPDTHHLSNDCAVAEAANHMNCSSGIPQISASSKLPNPHHWPGDSTPDLIGPDAHHLSHDSALADAADHINCLSVNPPLEIPAPARVRRSISFSARRTKLCTSAKCCDSELAIASSHSQPWITRAIARHATRHPGFRF